MKNFILVLSLLFAANISAYPLWSIDEVYNLGEVLHAARYDYEGGMKISFEKDYELAQKSSVECVSGDISEISRDFQSAISNHLRGYYDEEFDLDSAQLILNDELSSYKDIQKCLDSQGHKSFYSNDGELLVSYKLL